MPTKKKHKGGLFIRMPWKPGINGEAINSARQKNQRAEGQGFGCGPVEPFAGLEHLLLGVEQAGNRAVQVEVVRCRG